MFGREMDQHCGVYGELFTERAEQPLFELGIWGYRNTRFDQIGGVPDHSDDVSRFCVNAASTSPLHPGHKNPRSEITNACSKGSCVPHNLHVTT